MATNYQFPGNANTYIPSLSTDLMIHYGRDTKDFAINQYVKVTKSDKEAGRYPRFQNANQARFIRKADHVWPDGNDRPVISNGGFPFDFVDYRTERFSYDARIGYLAVEQASWDLLDQIAFDLGHEAMTARSNRLHTLLTTTTNYPSTNFATATASGGGLWANADATHPYIRTSIQYGINAIRQQTLDTVNDAKDFYLVINGTSAMKLGVNPELLDFLKQSPSSLALWEGAGDLAHRYNLPPTLVGCTVVVDNTILVTSEVSLTASPTIATSFPDNVALICTKQNAIKNSIGASFNTAQLIAYEEFNVEVFNDVRNRRYDVSVTENVIEVLPAPQSGFVITNLFS